MVPLGQVSFETLTADLDRLGISDSRYSLHHAAGADFVMVAVSLRFAELVEQTLATLN